MTIRNNLSRLWLLGIVVLSGLACHGPSRGLITTTRRAPAAVTGSGDLMSTSAQECVIVTADRSTVQQTGTQTLLLFEGRVDSASLMLASCGVNPGQNHTIYLNGQAVANVQDDAYRTCHCSGAVQPVAYPIDPTVIVSGWNYITITNDHDVTDSWMATDAYLVIDGDVQAAVAKEVTLTSSYDGSERIIACQTPVGYDPKQPVPLLVSIGGTGEDCWDALYHYAERANTYGWLLVAPRVRGLRRDWGGRTASLAAQRDVMDAIAYMQQHYAVDATRIYMSGFSAGGGVAATVAAKHPHVFAAVVDWIGPTDLEGWVEQRPELLDGLVVNDIGCAPTAGPDCRFEWQRRSAKEYVGNLKHVPMAIVHGRSDNLVPFAQSEEFYKAMSLSYDPESHNKVAVWHDGGHYDAVPQMRPLAFMSQFVLQPVPEEVSIRTDESKDYYWLEIWQLDGESQNAPGFSNVSSSFARADNSIWAEVWDERMGGEGNLPVRVSFDLVTMGLPAEGTFEVRETCVVTGERRTYHLPAERGRLEVTAERDATGAVHRSFSISLLR